MVAWSVMFATWSGVILAVLTLAMYEGAKTWWKNRRYRKQARWGARY